MNQKTSKTVYIRLNIIKKGKEFALEVCSIL